MASIARRPDGTYRPRYRDEHGKEHARHFKRKVDAQRWLDEVAAAVQTGTYVDPTRAKLTVGELAPVWLAGKINLKPTSRARYADVLKTHVLPRWGNVTLIRVTHGDVQAWLSKLSGRGLAGASVRKAQGVLSGILGLAVRDRRLAVNPALGVALPPMQEKRRRYLTAEQLEALADAAGPGRVAVLVLGYCGLRWSELAALRVRHFDLLRRRVLVEEAVTEVDGSRLVWGTPKTHGRRSVPLPRFLVDELARTVGDPPCRRAGLPLAAGRGAAQPQRPVRLVRRGGPGHRRARAYAARTPAHRSLAGDQGRRQRQGRAADARARLGGHDPGPLRRPVRRRPGRRGRPAGRAAGRIPRTSCGLFAD
jgi:integrase